MEKVFNKKLKKLIDSHSIISFDIFDTLIKRNCLNPTDIFEVVEKKYNENNEKNHLANFKNIRINAELECRSKTTLGEVSLDDIYSCITDLSDEQKKIIKKIEIDTEILFCIANKDFYEIYEYCKKNGKEIICISDMYLSKKIIQEILNKSGYQIDKLFLSSDVLKQKRDGTLFKYIIKDCGFDSKKILHIGDSKRADFLSPRLCGISSYLIPRFINNCTYMNNNLSNLSDKILYSYINNNNKKSDCYYNIGFELLGPIIFSYCKWLNKKVNDKEYKKIFFCARDMQLIQKIYNLMYPNHIDNEYLYISRKSMEKPYLYKNNTFDDFIKTVTPKKLNISDILKNKGIEFDNLNELLLKYDINEKEEFNNKNINCEKIKKFYTEVISKKIDTEFKYDYDNFIGYMKEIEFNPRDSALIDLGWKGTIQYTLQKTYAENIDGYYMGIEKDCFEEIRDYAIGYMFNKEENQEIEKKIYSFRSLFEMFFSATHGTTLGYTNEVGKRVILGEYENLNSDLINKIQIGAVDFVKGFLTYINYFDESINSYLINNLLEIGVNPNLKLASMFGELNFNNMISGKLASPKTITYYIFHLKDLKKDIFKSEWKIGFMKRLFKLKLPYYKIYSFLKKAK